MLAKPTRPQKTVFPHQKVIGGKWKLLIKNLAVFHEWFRNFSDHSKPLRNLRNEIYFSNLIRELPNLEGIGINKMFREELHLKTVKHL